MSECLGQQNHAVVLFNESYTFVQFLNPVSKSITKLNPIWRQISEIILNIYIFLNNNLFFN